MKNILKTTLALLFAGVINIQAATANETAWRELRATGPLDTVAVTPEAVAIKDSILAGQTITRLEASILELIVRRVDGREAWADLVRTLATSEIDGGGLNVFRAVVKHLDKDVTGWTAEMINARPDLAANAANSPLSTPEFRAQVWDAVKTRSAHGWRAFFKTYRSELPKSAQIAMTQQQKDVILAIPSRNASENSWLAEISADLIALQLDQ